MSDQAPGDATPGACASPPPPDPRLAPRAWLDWAFSLLVSPTCDGCTACAAKCAGDLPVWREEAEALVAAAAQAKVDLATTLSPTQEDQPCPFLDPATHLCRAYAVRPLVCRAFGLVPWLPCPLGTVSTNTTRRLPTPLPEPVLRQLLKGYTSRPRLPLSAWVSRLALPHHP